jgi:CheY-like chemotaxis protein
MPEMDGLETAERIGELHLAQKPVIIALTGEESGEVADAFRQRGCRAVLAKPMDEQKLFRVLEQCGLLTQQERPPETLSPAGMTDEEASALQVEGIDLESSQIRQRKTKAQYLDLLTLFYEDGIKQLQVWQSVPPERVKDYHIWVHALKSASANIGALTLSGLARAQEMAAKEGDLPRIEADFPQLMETYQSLLERIANKLRDTGPQMDQVTKPALETETLKGRLKEALELLEDFRREDSARSIGELLEHPLPDAVRNRLHEAQSDLNMYQDDDAEACLRVAVESV